MVAFYQIDADRAVREALYLPGPGDPTSLLSDACCVHLNLPLRRSIPRWRTPSRLFDACSRSRPDLGSEVRDRQEAIREFGRMIGEERSDLGPIERVQERLEGFGGK